MNIMDKSAWERGLGVARSLWDARGYIRRARDPFCALMAARAVRSGAPWLNTVLSLGWCALCLWGIAWSVKDSGSSWTRVLSFERLTSGDYIAVMGSVLLVSVGSSLALVGLLVLSCLRGEAQRSAKKVQERAKEALWVVKEARELEKEIGARGGEKKIGSGKRL
jgi:hypothetical protein